jgi:peptide/nickel transport system substrate-binding protein
MAGDPPGISTHINPAGTATPGLPDLVELTSPGLSSVGSDGALVPILAASLPAIENGSWTVSPDGSMQTTWKLREGVTWHDGHPFTSADLVLAATIGKDPELSEFGFVAYRFLDRVEAPDPLTVIAYWKQPYIDADTMFATFAEPMPSHILGPLYNDEKARIRESAYWTTEFVGTGPFQVREFVPGTGARLEAYPRYILGRPKPTRGTSWGDRRSTRSTCASSRARQPSWQTC